MAIGFQPSLAGVLSAAEQQSQVDKDFSVILFWPTAGPSHIDLFDLKPAAIAGRCEPIRTAVPGMEITELLPRLAAMADKFTLIRSLHSERNEEELREGPIGSTSGYPSKAANLNHGEYPELGSVVARSLDDRTGAAARQRDSAACRQHGLLWRRAGVSWSRPTLRTCRLRIQSPRRG